MALVLPDALGLVMNDKRRASMVDTRPKMGWSSTRTHDRFAVRWPGGDETAPLPVFSCRRRVPVGQAPTTLWSRYVPVDARWRAPRRTRRPAPRRRRRALR